MQRHYFFESLSKSIISELNRLLWNKERTINGYSIEKGKEKLTIKVYFSLKPPYSESSSIMIIARFSGIVEKWVSVWPDGKKEKPSPIDLFKDQDTRVVNDVEIKSICKQLLKEIDG